MPEEKLIWLWTTSLLIGVLIAVAILIPHYFIATDNDLIDRVVCSKTLGYNEDFSETYVQYVVRLKSDGLAIRYRSLINADDIIEMTLLSEVKPFVANPVEADIVCWGEPILDFDSDTDIAP